MAGDDILAKRGSALENQFFSEVDEKLLAALREEMEVAEKSNALAAATGIRDEAVLKSILAAGVSVQTLSALKLYPMIAVAWADGMLSESERETILLCAEKHGFDLKSPSGEILKSWLTEKPSADLLDAWKAFAQELVKHLSDEETATLRMVLVNEVKKVAEASGGLLGWSSISKGEHAVLNEIEAALS